MVKSLKQGRAAGRQMSRAGDGALRNRVMGDEPGGDQLQSFAIVSMCTLTRPTEEALAQGCCFAKGAKKAEGGSGSLSALGGGGCFMGLLRLVSQRLGMKASAVIVIIITQRIFTRSMCQGNHSTCHVASRVASAAGAGSLLRASKELLSTCSTSAIFIAGAEVNDVTSRVAVTAKSHT